MTSIEWTDRSWNPVTGCTKVSDGCDRCYAETFAERWRGVPGHPYEQGFDVTLRPGRLLEPLRWQTPARVFISMTDLLHEAVPDEYLARVFGVMGLARRHTFQVLTKRHGRLRALLGRPGFRDQVAEQASTIIGSSGRLRVDVSGWTPRPDTSPTVWVPPWPLPNVWIGVSVENQQWADIRVPALLDTPATTRFVSCEPLLGPLELANWLRPDQGRGLDWVIVGGESGPGARPVELAWIAELVTACNTAAVPIFVKQMGALFARRHGGPAKGGDPQRWPESLRVRQFPPCDPAGIDVRTGPR